uniref:Uncharacterized protein n=1 Tax=Phasianus colchicus TaxID=9054 RepID=A0A669P3I6_PHACC
MSSFQTNIQLDGSEQHAATQDSACCDLTSPETTSIEHQHNEMGDHDMNHKEIFTFSSRPRSAPHGKSPNISPEHCIFPLDLKQDSNCIQGETQTKDNFQGTDGSEEVGHFVRAILDKIVFVLKLLNKSSFPHVPLSRFVSVNLLYLTEYRGENEGIPSVTRGQKKLKSLSALMPVHRCEHSLSILIKEFRKACIIDFSKTCLLCLNE